MPQIVLLVYFKIYVPFLDPQQPMEIHEGFFQPLENQR